MIDEYTKVFHECKEKREDCCETRITYKQYASGEFRGWYMDDGEYYPTVYYCPYCGEKLDESPQVKQSDKGPIEEMVEEKRIMRPLF